MIISTTKLKEMEQFKDLDEKLLERKLKGIERAILSHTNNKFQNRLVRFRTAVVDKKLTSSSSYLKIDDTIEISDSINKGLYVIKDITDNSITLDRELFDCEDNLITKIEYPEDVIEGAITLLEWETDSKEGKTKVKKGIASESETLSRHSQSTTYKSYDNNNMIKGYPAELMNFLEPYISLRY